MSRIYTLSSQGSLKFHIIWCKCAPTRISVFTAAPPDAFLSGKVELIFDKLTDQGLHHFLMKLTYGRSPPWWRPGSACRWWQLPRTEGTRRSFPGFLTWDRSEPPSLPSRCCRHCWTTQSSSLQGATIVRCKKQVWSWEEEIRRWCYSLRRRGRSSWSERGNRCIFLRAGRCSCR